MEIILKQCDCGGISVITDAIIPILLAVITVYAAEYFARKRDYKQKKIEVQIDYLKQCIEYVAELEEAALELSRCIDNILNKDLSKRGEMVNTVANNRGQIIQHHKEKILKGKHQNQRHNARNDKGSVRMQIQHGADGMNIDVGFNDIRLHDSCYERNHKRDSYDLQKCPEYHHQKNADQLLPFFALYKKAQFFHENFHYSSSHRTPLECSDCCGFIKAAIPRACHYYALLCRRSQSFCQRIMKNIRQTQLLRNKIRKSEQTTDYGRSLTASSR